MFLTSRTDGFINFKNDNYILSKSKELRNMNINSVIIFSDFLTSKFHAKLLGINYYLLICFPYKFKK